QRRALSVDVESALAREDIDDLVVAVEVVRRAPGGDVADELGHRRAAVLRVRQQAELPSGGRRAALASRGEGVARRRRQRILDEHGEELQALSRLDLPRSATCDEDPGPRFEP